MDVLIAITVGAVAALSCIVAYLFRRVRELDARPAIERGWVRQEAQTAALHTMFASQRDTLPGLGGWTRPPRPAMGSDHNLQ